MYITRRAKISESTQRSHKNEKTTPAILFDRAKEVKKAELYAFENLPDMTTEQREGAMIALSMLHNYADRVVSGAES